MTYYQHTILVVNCLLLRHLSGSHISATQPCFVRILNTNPVIEESIPEIFSQFGYNCNVPFVLHVSIDRYAFVESFRLFLDESEITEKGVNVAVDEVF